MDGVRSRSGQKEKRAVWSHCDFERSKVDRELNHSIRSLGLAIWIRVTVWELVLLTQA